MGQRPGVNRAVLEELCGETMAPLTGSFPVVLTSRPPPGFPPPCCFGQFSKPVLGISSASGTESVLGIETGDWRHITACKKLSPKGKTDTKVVNDPGHEKSA